jgi:hypothetical protein
MRRGSGRGGGTGAEPGFSRPPDARPRPAGGHGRGNRERRGAARPGRAGAGAVRAPERASDRARGDRRSASSASFSRAGRTSPPMRARSASRPAMPRFSARGSESFDTAGAIVAALRQGLCRSRAAGRRDPARPDPRPRCGRGDAGRARRQSDVPRAARRQEPVARVPGRGARAGLRPSRRA